MISNYYPLGKRLKLAIVAAAMTCPQFALAQVEINSDNFPDDAFRAVVETFDNNPQDGILSKTELSAVTEIGHLNWDDYYDGGPLDNQGIEDMTGIEYFTNLTQLSVSNNDLLESLDLTALTKLQNLCVYGCSSLTTLNIEGLTKLVNLQLDGCGLEELTLSGLERLTNIYFRNAEYLTTLTIDNCKRLTEFWVENDESLTTLTVTNNAALENIHANNNEALAALDVSGNNKLVELGIGENGLTTLNVSGLPKLERVYAYTTFSELKDIDASNCPKLTSLEYNKEAIETLNHSGDIALYSLDFNEFPVLTTLNLSGCTGLVSASVHHNEELTTLDVSGGTALLELRAYENENLENIDYSNCPILRYLGVWNDPHLTTLDVSGLTQLEELYCDGTGIETLDVSGMTKLRNINAYNNGNLKTINAVGCTALTDLGRITSDPWYDGDYAGLTTLNLSGCNSITYFRAERLPVIENIDLSGCTALTDIGIYDKESLKTLNVSGLTALTQLSVYNNANLEAINVTSMENLERLEVYGNNLKNIDLSTCTALTYVGVYNNHNLTSLDVSTLTELETLYCDGTAIETLDVSGLTKLTGLNAFNNENLKTINAAGCTALSDIGQITNDWYWGNEGNTYAGLTTLNLSGCTSITGFTAERLPVIENIDLSGCTGMTGINVWGRETLKALNVSGNSSLTELRVYDNANLETIDLTDCSALDIIYVPNNKLTALVCTSPMVTYIEAHNNQLTSIDVTNFSGLTYLNLNNNQITEIDLSKNKNLNDFYCANNQLTTLDISACTVLRYLNCSGNQLTSLDTSAQTDGFWGFEARQSRTVDLMTLSATEVGFQVDDTFDSDKVESLSVDFSSMEPRFVTVDGKRYFIVYDNAAEAESLKSKPITYNYRTRENTDYMLEITLMVNDIVKGPQSLVIAGAASVKGVYGGEIEAPAVTVPVGYDGTLSYVSGDENVVTVDADGNLTIVGAGTTTITVSGTESTYGAAPADVTYEVVIEKATVTLAFAESELNIIQGEAVPENALNKGVYDGTIVYTSSDEAIATVSAEGEVTVLADGTVTITANGAETNNCNEAIAASYTLNVQKADITIALPAGKQYATFATNVDLDFEGSDFIAYTGVVEGTQVILTPVTKVPAGTGVLLKGKTAGQTGSVKTTKGLEALTDNDFVAVLADMVAPADAYILATVDGVQAFYKANGNTIEAGHAYLKAEAGARLIMVFDGEATGVASVSRVATGEQYYDLNGRRVAQPKKGGMYILNGKKVVVK